ncbi:cytochrome c biogenesis protein CcdA [Candidatus Woesearchaeota archaeon]|nr:cytochrome c biogenesis protein CcdA [Candidatus Woesearchaeota archaeon]
MNRTILIILALSLFLVIPLAYADAHLPIGLLKIQEENQRIASETVAKVSFLIAFLAGVTTVLSPCILPLLPAFFAYTFKERKQITKMTLMFFFGFAPVFALLGIVATAAGKSLVVLIGSLNFFVMIAGFLLLTMGIFYFFGKGFSLIPVKARAHKKGILGILAYGALFGLGWIACTGPILSGVLLAASIFQNYVFAVTLMLSYSFGVFVPLFLLSFFYDKLHLEKSKFMQGKEFNIELFGKKIKLHSSNIIAGSMLIILGLVFIIYRGTWIVNGITFFGLKNYFYTFQNWILNNIAVSNLISVFILGAIVLGIWMFVRARGKK